MALASEALSSTWRINVSGQVYGPYSGHQIKAFASEGRVAPHSIVQSDGGPWITAIDDPVLAQLFVKKEPPKQAAQTEAAGANFVVIAAEHYFGAAPLVGYGDGCDAFCFDEIPPPSRCGDGHIDEGEECDDGNTTSGDGCSEYCLIESPVTTPANLFNSGDSIGEAEAADGTIGEAHHETVWSTGFNGGDIVATLNERFEFHDASNYYETTL